MSADIRQSFINSRATQGINILRIANAVKDGETVVIGSKTFEASFDNVVPAGRISINLLAAASLVAATGVLTVASGQRAMNNETVVIQGVTYTFKDTLSTGPAVAFEVKKGASLAEDLSNLAAAINKGDGEGTAYGTGTTANPYVTAVADGTARTVTVAAKVKGTPANAYTTTETMTQGSWGGATLSGGADASAADFSTAFALAVNQNGGSVGFSATKISNNEVLVTVSGNNSPNGTSFSETLSGTNNAWASTTLIGAGQTPEDIPAQALVVRSPTATEVALGNMHFVFPFKPTRSLVQVQTTSTGAGRAWDGTRVITGNRITLAGGTTPLAATETITLLATE